ncbi:MAG TPA: chitobiase/beta-hexosaminidase C-terminal domain-containing protein, partial [Thermoanaerobaculia bacterium]|nr:chitobiase/beta-hexosaminidase C-terminal domain-containing protein [Thermoanaerobaculia bacterium]
MRRLGGAFLAVVIASAAPLAAQETHHHGAAPAAASADASSIAAAAAKAGVATPTFSPAPGTLTAPNNQVTLASATAGATIYYTTDGTSPSRKKSPVYTGPIAITATTTLKAFAYKKGMTASGVTSGVYTYDSSPPPPPSETGGTLFVGTLTPQGAATSSGSGSATLTLTQDQK